MEAKRFLLQIKKLDRLIENKLAEVQRLKEMAMSVTGSPSSDRVQSMGNPSRMADTIAKYIDLENEINADIDRLIEVRKEVISVIEQLDAVEYDILHKLYVQDWTLQEVADKYERAYGWAAANQTIAINRVQAILDRQNEPTSV